MRPLLVKPLATVRSALSTPAMAFRRKVAPAWFWKVPAKVSDPSGTSNPWLISIVLNVLLDRKSVVEGKSVVVRGRLIVQNNIHNIITSAVNPVINFTLETTRQFRRLHL